MIQATYRLMMWILLGQACLSSFQFFEHMTSLLKLDMKLGFDYAQSRQSSLSNLETQFELTIQIMAWLYERSRNQPQWTLILSHYYLNFAVKAFKMIETIVDKTSGEVNTLRLMRIVIDHIITMDIELSFPQASLMKPSELKELTCY